ncbi:hypothetical protein EDEG_04097 [Edhazardia aedis USNM 41457]|uniref:Uncharacterized protein n=1 Tax=Edhazardia aedis (strain USNM 41457) TaxID=1003232 RepID=J9DCR1_EDHAE|nr:hypothetical protein EDEG_04097 [Edhazardia aedis USNM 41457]|eukprot:EJW05254.1 hypothetical protein EDEG_04097 [Edhazardia aedis USNM 41457]
MEFYEIIAPEEQPKEERVISRYSKVVVCIFSVATTVIFLLIAEFISFGTVQYFNIDKVPAIICVYTVFVFLIRLMFKKTIEWLLDGKNDKFSVYLEKLLNAYYKFFPYFVFLLLIAFHKYANLLILNLQNK